MIVRSIELHENKIKFATNNGIYELLNDNSIGISDKKSNFTYLLKNFGENLYRVDNRGIYVDSEKIINSSEYFNDEVQDIFVKNDIIYIGTNNALVIYNQSEKLVENIYDYSFLKKINKIDAIDEFLILLTSKGLVKFKL